MSSATTRPWLQYLAVIAAVALVLFVWPTEGFARARLSNGETPGTAEGDPIDSNDYGGAGGSGSGDDVEDSYAVAPTPRLPVVRLGGWVIVIVPDVTFGSAGFTFRIVDVGAFVTEARYAQ
jgi:hypothetical protein